MKMMHTVNCKTANCSFPRPWETIYRLNIKQGLSKSTSKTLLNTWRYMSRNLNLASVCNMKITRINDYELFRQYAINGMLLYLSIKQLIP